MKKILFVDDEERVLEGLEDLLRPYRRKWQMTFVTSGQDALERAAQDPFDVLVTDMRMPGMDGATLLQRVHDRHPNVVRIVLSGHTEVGVAVRAVPIAHQFLSKPAKGETIENVIERACDLKSLISDDAVRSVVAKLKQLPSVPRIYQSLTEALADERTSGTKIAELIEQDPAMCAKVLQIVNSSFFGLGRRMTSVKEAVIYLGCTMIKNLVLSVEVFKSNTCPRVRGFSVDDVRRHAIDTAALARKIAGKDRRLAEDSFIAAVLHDVGKLVLASELPEHLQKALEIAAREGRRLFEVEEALGSVTHAEVGAYLLGIWGLPYSVVEAVAYHHHPERVQQQDMDALAVVHIANELMDELRNGGSSAALLEYAHQWGVAERLGEWRDFARAAPGAEEAGA